MKESTAHKAQMPEFVQFEVQMFIGKLVDVAVTMCSECDGIGHTRKDCGTYIRIQKLTKGVASWKSIANWARKDVIGDHSKVLLGKRMRWSID